MFPSCCLLMSATCAPVPGTRARCQVFIALAVALGLAVVPGTASAQADVAHGTRVRVHPVSGRPMVGTLVVISGDSLRVRTLEAGDITLPASDVRMLERSVGRERRFWRNFALTNFGLTVAGGVIGAATYEPCDCFFFPSSRGGTAVLGALVGAVIGVPVGALVGSVVVDERWVPVEGIGSSGRRVSLRPTIGNRIGVAASWSFGTTTRH